MKKRGTRIVFGIIVLILFCAYSYFRISSSPRSRDIGPAEPAPSQAVESLPPEGGDAQPSEEPVETPEPTLDPNSPAGRAAALNLPAPPDIDVTSWEFMLANADHSIEEYAPPELVSVEGLQFDSRIVDALNAFVQDTRDQGLNVYLSSAYRSYSDQAANFQRVVGNGYPDGKTSNGFYVTMPAGCSEHQTGLVCDITDVYYPLKNSSIENTETFKYMSAHCQDFGFILRFPSDKEDVTGVMYEPWHYRYVGIDAAKYIMENGLCLEEFLALYGVE